MNDSKALQPDDPRHLHPQAMATFTERLAEGPVTMLNLLKFKPGKAATYMRYSQLVGPMVSNVGGRLVFAGRPAELLTGNASWDYMLLVEYPTRAAMAGMIRSEEYKEVAHLRTEAVERAVLYAVDPEDGKG